MIIWEAMLDNRYKCEVSRIDDYSGELTVRDTVENVEMLKETVSLMFGAAFGPDFADVVHWEEKCIAAVPEVSND